MEQETHVYQTQIEWAEKRRGTLQADGLPDLMVSTPPEFKGEAGFWTPEHLYVAAAEACLMATFLGIAENSRLKVASYRSSARGRLGKVPGAGLCFSEVEIFPEVELEEGDSLELAERVMAKAAKGCLIANSLKAAVLVKPKFAVKKRVAA